MQNFFSSGFTLGVIGGGQLGKMLLHETSRMDIDTAVLDPSSDAPCHGLAGRFEVGSLRDADTVVQFGKNCDIVTFEIEHISIEGLEKLESMGIPVHPLPSTLKIIQNKVTQKKFYRERGIPTAPFESYQYKAELDPQDFPVVWKAATGGYDGKGVIILKDIDDWNELPDMPGLLEEFVGGDMKEVSVVISRNEKGQTAIYPPVEMEFHPEANLVEFLKCPASLEAKQVEEMNAIARELAEALNLIGLMAIELFLLPDGRIWVNEAAPRPHNSGHHTIESNYTSQFAQHLRAILGLPPGSTEMKTAGVMVNILGEPGYEGQVYYQGMDEVLAIPGVNVHIYGKKKTRPFRKMGHVTIIDESLEDAMAKARKVKETLKAIS